MQEWLQGEVAQVPLIELLPHLAVPSLRLGHVRTAEEGQKVSQCGSKSQIV